MWKSRWTPNSLRSKRKRPPVLEQLEDRRLFATNITQYHVDYQSTGANLTETQLTSSNVNAADFGQLYNTSVDGQVYAEPLVLTNVTIAAGPNTVGSPGTYASVVFVATQHDSLYAINAANGAILWHRTFLDTSNTNDYLPGASAVTSCPTGTEPLNGQPAIGSTDISPEVGITGTPVIDPSTNILYVLVKTKETVSNVDHYVQRLHAISIADGTDAVSSFLVGDTANGNTNNTPIFVNGTGDGNVNGVVQFNALREANRPALSLVNGQVYVEWASHGDEGPYHGWVVTWNVANLSTQGMVLSGVLCTDPTGGEGGIWGGGGGLTFDPDETFNGQPAFYFETGNGDPRGGNPPLDGNGFPSDHSYYESLVKVEADPTTNANNQNSNGWGLKIADYFTPYNVNALDDADEDFGSGSPLVLPDSAGIPGHPHLIVAAGKEGKIYLVDRDNLGKFNANDDNVLNSVYNSSTGITTPPVLINGSLSTPAFYHGALYWVSGYTSNAWSYIVAPNPAPNPPTVPVAALQPTSETANGNFGYVPGSVMISANGSEDPAGGIVWIMDRNNNELHAYSSLSLSTELWNSGSGSIATVKFAVPTIANGQVFVGTQNSLQAFGITGPGTPAQAPNAPANVAAMALSGSAVELTWTDNTVSPNFATSYAIQEFVGGKFVTVATAAQESTSYTVTGLNQGTAYSFRIVGSNSAGASGPSNTANITTTNQTGQTPTAPLGLGATPASGSEVYLTWTNTASNETGFTLTRATDSLFTQNVVTETLASAPFYYTDGAAGLSPGNTYYYRLQASNSSGLSSTSNTASVNIPNVPPAPTNASAVLNGNQVVVSWTDHAGPFALGYQIERSVDGGAYAIYAVRPETSDAPPSTQTYTDTNVPVGHTYSYEIVAENVSGFSAPAYATVSVLGQATVSLDNAGNLAFTSSPGVPDRLSVQLAAGIYTLTDPAVTITVTGAGAGFVTGNGTSAVTIPAAQVSAMTLDTSDNTDAIRIISDAVPISITADSGGGVPTINLGDPTNNEVISGTITNAGNGALLISGSGTTTINGNLIGQGSGGVTLAGTGTINIAGNINLGPAGNLTDSGSGPDTISGVISGTASSGSGLAQGLIGTYFNINSSGNLIQPAAPSNPAWLGNQTPAVTAQLIGPLDFPDIADNGFADSVGDPAYYNLGGGNNNQVEGRWYGEILIPGSGSNPVPINFATTSDDGSMLYIDGNTVVNNNFYQGATQRTGLAHLTPGLHAIDAEFYQGGGGASLDVQWDTSGGSNFVDIPNSAFSSIQAVNGLVMTGTGTLTLSNTNTYSGSTTIEAGTLVVAANGALGSATATGILVNAGGALALTGGLSYATAEPLTISGYGPAGNGAIENISGTNTLTMPITVAGAAAIGSDSGAMTLGGNISCPGTSLTLSGTGAINIAGNIDLGPAGNLTDSSSGQDTITGVISGTASSGLVQGLIGTYFNINSSGNLIQPAAPSNPAWLGNQTPAVTAKLIGPLDFPDIADNGFADSVGDPAYYNLGGGNNNQVEGRWYGEILIPGSGSNPVPINFATTSDDGSMLYIDGNTVVNNNFYQGATQRTSLAHLTPGLHAIDVEFYQGGGGASLDVQWDTSGGSNFVDIPNSAFFEPFVNALTKTGTGTLTLANTDTYRGPTTVNAGTLLVNGQVLNSPVTVNAGGTLGGAGSVPTTTVQSGGFLSPGDPLGTLTAGGLSLATGSTFIEGLGGASAGTQYSQTVLTAGGTAALGTSTLNVSFLDGFLPTAGQQFTIINNQTGHSIGTFSQGSTYVFNNYIFAINYAGGAGNDVVLTVLDNTATTISASTSVGSPPTSSLYGQAVTFTATVAPNALVTGTPVGTVTFSDGSTILGTVSLSNGSASLTTATLAVGSHTITASFTGTNGWQDSADSLTQTVSKDSTATAIASSANPSVNGQTVTITATVTAKSPGSGIPAGTVTFKVNGTAEPAAKLNAAGQAIFTFSPTVGTYNVIATYNGGANFTFSNSSNLSQVVNKDGTTTTLVSSANPSVNGQTVTFTATVTANSPGSGTPPGTVTFKVNGTAQPAVKLNAQGKAVFAFSPTVGTYTVTASYNGGANFTFSTSPVLHQVVNKDATTVALVSSLNPSTSGQAVTFTVTVSAAAPGSGVPSGTVEFLDGTTVLGFRTLSAGQATFKTSTLSVGSHAITAKYEGDSLFNVQTSAVLNQKVNAAAILEALLADLVLSPLDKKHVDAVFGW